MKSFVALSILASLASSVSAFGLVSIHSGTSYQYLSVENAESGLVLGSGQGIDFTLHSDGTLWTSDGKGIRISGSGNIYKDTTADGGFSIVDNNLAYGGIQGFMGCPSGAVINLVFSAAPGEDNAACPNGGTGVALYVAGGASSSSSAASSTPASSAPASSAPSAVTTTDLSTTLKTITSCGPEVTNCPASNYTAPPPIIATGAAASLGSQGVVAAGIAMAAGFMLL